jgi:hypothetical protein
LGGHASNRERLNARIESILDGYGVELLLMVILG